MNDKPVGNIDGLNHLILQKSDDAELLNGEVPVVSKKKETVDISNKLQEIQLGFPLGNTVDSHLAPP